MTGPMPPDDMSFEDPGFDALDTALGERLRAAAPAAPDVDATLAGLRPGFTRARRRHQTVLAGAATLCVVAIVGIGAAVLPGDGTGDVKTPPATRPDTTTTVPTVPTTVPTTDLTTPTSVEAPGGTLPGGTTPGTVDDHGGGGGGGDDSGSGSSGSGSSGSGSGSSGSGSSGSGSGGGDD